jgi:hypothetical protein
MKNSKIKRGMMIPSHARDLVIQFFEGLLDRRFTDAERTLVELREKRLNEEEFKKGYLHALEGLVLSSRSGDEREFYNWFDFNPDALKEYKQEFREFVKDNQHSTFDKGYFSAWSDLVQYRRRINE